jgi:hypothetical protein
LNKYIFIFVISIFLVLSISGAGIFLNDEWMVAQQVHQISEGHQLFYNEGKYGYYSNGTAGFYMTARLNMLIYPLALPILSFPVFLLFTTLSTEFTRIFIILLWGIMGWYILTYIRQIIGNQNASLLAWGFIALVWFNLLAATNFIMSGEYIPYEMISVGFTNILLFGIFSVTCFKLSELLFADKFKQIVAWISCISLNSLMFWSTTLKDHMLLATIIMISCYLHISYNKTEKNNIINLYLSYIVAGFTMWIRPEIGLFLITSMIIFDLYYNRNIIFGLIAGLCSSIGIGLMMINNQIIMGNPFSSPFLYALSHQTSSDMAAQVLSGSTQIPFAQITTFDAMRWIKFIFVPDSGALGLVVPLCLFFFAILVYIKHRPKLSTDSKFLLVVGTSTIIYYLLYSGPYMSADGGVIPDIRYFSAAYALFTLFALSILPYDINYRKIFKNIFIYVPIIIILSLFIISVYPPAGSTYKEFRMIPHIISTISLSIMLILLVNDGNTKPTLLERIIPIAIASAFTWQVIMIFVYHISKAHYYPMFIPVTEIIYKLLFGV